MKRVLSLFLFFASISVSAEDWLVVQKSTASTEGPATEVYNLATKPIVTFSADSIYIKCEDLTFVQFAQSEVSRVYFDSRFEKDPVKAEDPKEDPNPWPDPSLEPSEPEPDDPGQDPDDPGKDDPDTPDTPDEVVSLAQDVFTFSYRDGETILLTGVPSEMSILVFSVDGKSMPLNMNRVDNTVILHVNDYQSGVYVIRVGNKSYKIRKK